MFRTAPFDMNPIGLVILFTVGFHRVATTEKIFNYTIGKLTSDYVKSEVLIRDKCMLKLLKEAVKEFGSTYMFIKDNHYHTHLLHSLQNKFMHSHYTEPDSLTPSKLENFDNLIIFRDKFQLRDVIRKKQPFQATKFFLLLRDYEDVVEQFQTLWEKRLVNAVAAYLENRTVYFYTYFPYCASHCGRVGQPHLLASCDITNGVFSHRERLFPAKTANLHGCPVSVTFIEHVPASYYSDAQKPTGWEVDLLNEILRKLNGVAKYKIIDSQTSSYTKSEGYRSLVEKSEIGGGMTVSLRSLAETDFVLYGMSVCATWAVPRKMGSPLSADFLTKVFPPNVWILVFLAYFSMAATVRAFFKVSNGNILFKLIPYLLGTTTRTKRTSRSLGALWLWFCLIMTSIYQCGYQSTLLVPNLPEQITGTRQIIASKLKIIGVADLITDVIPFFQRRYNISRRKYRSRGLTYDNWVHKMTVTKDCAYLGFKEILQYHLKRTDLANKIYTTDDCVIKYLLAFVLKKNSHLQERVKRYANRLNEKGFLTFFMRKHLLTESRGNIPKKITEFLKPSKDGGNDGLPPPINMDKMSVVFMCHTGGILLAFAAFVAEHISTWDWKEIKTWILKELQKACPCQ